MGVDTNYSKWTCDKKNCSTEEHIKVGGAREAAWGKFDRIDSNGVSTEYYLCPEHKTKYQELVQQEDKDFQTWLNGVDE